MQQKHYTIPVFVPELACPNRCVFCNQQKISGHISIPTEPEIHQQINQYLESFTEGAHIELGFFGGSFSGIPAEEQIRFLKIAQPYLEKGAIHGLRISTRPDYISEQQLNLLKKYNVSTIELGTQSLAEDVLLLSKRGHTIADVDRAASLIKAYGFSLGLQMMTGLPGDTLEKTLYTARRIVELGADNTRIYPTLVIKNTELEELYSSGLYTPLTIEQAVDRVKQLIPIFEAAGITIIRIGLHPSEGLLNGTDLVAGPFHPAFREMVESALWSDIFKPLYNLESDINIEISTPTHQRTMAIGYQAANKKQLETKFRRVRFTANESLQNHDFTYRLF